jgi:hypothetical protein
VKCWCLSLVRIVFLVSSVMQCNALRDVLDKFLLCMTTLFTNATRTEKDQNFFLEFSASAVPEKCAVGSFSRVHDTRFATSVSRVCSLAPQSFAIHAFVSCVLEVRCDGVQGVFDFSTG